MIICASLCTPSVPLSPRPIGLAATLWTCFLTVAFCLPALNPVDTQTLNYTPVAVGIIFAGAMISWVLFARKTFKGPLATIALENRDVLERQGIDAEQVKREKEQKSKVKIERVPSREESE